MIKYLLLNQVGDILIGDIITGELFIRHRGIDYKIS